ncbi:MAG TPA: ATPase, T2SS/T4P/T4SS family, partial [bacterium]|nr:ATPase, T2SS/T4P/T4SS family [bacterium]
HKDKNCIITQREIGFDTADFHTALVAAMRQNPDIILIGEMRDSDTVDAALSAAETGHLVISTLHTVNAAQTISRILEFYPKEQHDQIRAQLAEYLIATISQRLVPLIDNSGVVPAVEIMIQNPMIKKLIIENRIEKLKSVIHQGKNEGMQTFDQSLVELFKKGLISENDAKSRCSKPSNFKLYCEGHFPDVDIGIIS